MGRLIDADVLKKDLTRFYDGEVVARKLIDEQPTVDAVPVVHAHWIRHENADIVDGYLVPNFECSECHSWKKDDSDYCPDCGAKMEEDKVDDETK